MRRMVRILREALLCAVFVLPLYWLSTSAFGQPGVSPPPVRTNAGCVSAQVVPGDKGVVQLVSQCGRAVNIYFCIEPRASAGLRCLPANPADQDPVYSLPGTGAVQPTFNVARDITSLHVHVCDAPLKPWDVTWRQGAIKGYCMDPSLPLPGKRYSGYTDGKERIPPLRNLPATWPRGISTPLCIVQTNELDGSGAYELVNQCNSKVKLVVCTLNTFIPRGVHIDKGGPTGCDPLGMTTPGEIDPGERISMPAITDMDLWSVFGCMSPEEPKDLAFNGTRLTGRCEKPVEEKKDDLPKRGSSALTQEFKTAISEEERERALALRQQQEEAERQQALAQAQAAGKRSDAGTAKAGGRIPAGSSCYQAQEFANRETAGVSNFDGYPPDIKGNWPESRSSLRFRKYSLYQAMLWLEVYDRFCPPDNTYGGATDNWRSLYSNGMESCIGHFSEEQCRPEKTW